jgi:Arc-like DNA binding domain
MKKRKRASGAGRKPAGQFAGLSAPFNVRMPPELRAALEEAAKRRGRSMSQELLARLAYSFHRDREQAHDPAMRALCYLIADTARFVSGLFSTVDNKPHHDWRSSPFMFEAFKLAVAHLLNALRPKGEIRSPLEELPMKFEGTTREEMEATRFFVDSYATPEARARIAFETVWNAVLTYDPRNVEEPPQDLYGSGDLRKRLKQWDEARAYGMADARRDLKLKPMGVAR